MARDANGRSVLPSDPAANSWSAAGAVMAAAHLHAAEEDDDTDPQAFALAMSALSSVVNAGPQSWNDRPERTTDEVITALTEAIDLLTGRRRP